MDYNINDFVARLRERMYSMFPYEPDFINEQKHIVGTYGPVKNPKPRHIRDVAFKDNVTEIINENMLIFDIGNEYAEREYPYYHILEDAPVIRKKGRATEKTKGSQDKVTDLGSRNYGIVSFKGKVFSKEYDRNVRGARKSVITRSTRYIKDYNGDTIKINRGANSYQNVHYHYIENMMSMLLPQLAVDFNMKMGRTIDSGLAEEFVMDNYNLPTQDYSTTQQVLQILGM